MSRPRELARLVAAPPAAHLTAGRRSCGCLHGCMPRCDAEPCSLQGCLCWCQHTWSATQPTIRIVCVFHRPAAVHSWCSTSTTWAQIRPASLSTSAEAPATSCEWSHVCGPDSAWSCSIHHCAGACNTCFTPVFVQPVCMNTVLTPLVLVGAVPTPAHATHTNTCHPDVPLSTCASHALPLCRHTHIPLCSAQYYQLLRLGRTGYERIMHNLDTIAQRLADGILATGAVAVPPCAWWGERSSLA